jgi:hypothetical protein
MNQLVANQCSIINIEQKEPEQRLFFTTVSTQLFSNVHKLFEQINAQFTARSPDESVGAQMAAFCVYSCALFSAYLCKYPNSMSPSLNLTQYNQVAEYFGHSLP